jgi:hypothetical protein
MVAMAKWRSAVRTFAGWPGKLPSIAYGGAPGCADNPTANELRAAGEEDGWVLAVVTEALDWPSVVVEFVLVPMLKWRRCRTRTKSTSS